MTPKDAVLGDYQPPSTSERPSGEGGENRSDAARLLEERLCEIVKALGGREVGTNGRELWFHPATVSEIEIRLSADLDAPSYDRSTNLAISYRGRSDEAPSPVLLDVIASIKTIDETRLEDVVPAFGAAATHAMRRISDVGRYQNGGGNEIGSVGGSRRASEADGSVTSGWPAAMDGNPSEPDPRWERVVTRELNVVFCDLGAQLVGGGQPLTPLHWGFWPAGVQAPAAEADDFEPFWAFSENLLAYVPDTAIRILDVGCGLGANAKLLSQRSKVVTAVSPVAHHCESIEQACLPNVEVRCTRFEDMSPDEPYDLLLFSESVNHFPLGDNFLEHCKRFLAPSGFLLLADDLTEERARKIEEQHVFRILRAVDISVNVAPTSGWWMRQTRAFKAYRTALMSILDMHDPPVAARVREVLDTLDSSELRVLMAGGDSVPTSKGRYMIYLLQRD